MKSIHLFFESPFFGSRACKCKSPCPLGAFRHGFHTQNNVPITLTYVNSLCCIGGAGLGVFLLLTITLKCFTCL